MSLSNTDMRFLQNLSRLTYCNPFEEERIELERIILGNDYQHDDLLAWSRTRATEQHERANVRLLTDRANKLSENLLQRQLSGEEFSTDECELYADLIMYVLYYRFLSKLPKVFHKEVAFDSVQEAWQDFNQEHHRLVEPLKSKLASHTIHASAHLFACLYQVARAFRHIFNYLIGDSKVATQLRATVWQSIFTHDLKRYRATLYNKMHDFSTLITGPSGSGKELVARAIGLSQYYPFKPTRGEFDYGDTEQFLALNLSALSPTLIESELFGHRKGSFTGATSDRIGWLEKCTQQGVVFLDELGELDLSLQVKLLRVAQNRTFIRLGENKERRFHGKIIAATNRDMAKEISEGRFREDLYYRLCSDRIEVPSLSDHLTANPNFLTGLVHHLVERTLGKDSAESIEVEQFTESTIAWIGENLPDNYSWPGNVRELEQCIRNLIIRNQYAPPRRSDSRNDALPEWIEATLQGNLTADELLNKYAKMIYDRAGTYEAASKILNIDRRTVKSRIQSELDA